jgi:hypothetical protein
MSSSNAWAEFAAAFRQTRPAFLQHENYEATGEAPSAEAIRSALDLFEARAQFDGPQRAIHVRTAAHG